MPLDPGTRLGPYEILSPLGAGGMGEVYSARDTRLDRTVAVKVLPGHLSEQPDVRARFEREARAASSLNHPNICVLHDVGRQDGIDFLVMEQLDGETLASRLARGPLPSRDLIEIGTQMADALEKAHGAGIVHRDLKPANVMLTRSGAKLLDFGLARATGLASTTAGLTHSPTMSGPLTAEGTILGTFQYMSPEQLEGQEADARSDIWALGCVLYEMASGRPAFEGKSQASLIGAIMSTEPPALGALQPATLGALEPVVRGCLTKDPARRIQSAHDVKLQLEWIAQGATGAESRTPTSERARRTMRVAIAAAALGALGVVVLGGLLLSRPAPRAETVRFQVPLPSGLRSADTPRLSPDGRHIAFNAVDSTGVSRIWLRSLDDLVPNALPGTEGTTRPFWSPDSRYLAFVANGKLKKIAVGGGPPVVLCDAPTGSDGSWGRRGTILFDGASSDPIRAVSDAGGVPSAAVRPDTTKAESVGWPEFLPDGRRFLYLALGSTPMLMAGTLGSTKATSLGPIESQVSYVEPGYLLFTRSGTLVAQRFDARRLKLKGDPFPVVAERVAPAPNGQVALSVSKNGTLAYTTSTIPDVRYVWVGRDGRELGQVTAPVNGLAPWLSPDGTRMAIRVLSTQQTQRDIWVIDLVRGMSSRLTFSTANENFPIWSPDGTRILYQMDGPSGGLYITSASGAGGEQQVFKSSDAILPTDWSRDGRFVLYQAGGGGGSDIWVLPLGAGAKPFSFLSGTYNEVGARFSPDGRFVAYASSESGRNEVYVQTFPDHSGKWQISSAGGTQPAWSGNGRELLYVAADGRMMSVPVQTTPSFTAELPRPLFTAPLVDANRNTYAVTGDGQRFLLLEPMEHALPAMTVVLNWIGQLRRH